MNRKLERERLFFSRLLKYIFQSGRLNLLNLFLDAAPRDGWKLLGFFLKKLFYNFQIIFRLVRKIKVSSRSLSIHFISMWEVSKLTYFTKNSSLSSQTDHQIQHAPLYLVLRSREFDSRIVFERSSFFSSDSIVFFFLFSFFLSFFSPPFTESIKKFFK